MPAPRSELRARMVTTLLMLLAIGNIAAAIIVTACFGFPDAIVNMFIAVGCLLTVARRMFTIHSSHDPRP